jgi:hypothetical protein
MKIRHKSSENRTYQVLTLAERDPMDEFRIHVGLASCQSALDTTSLGDDKGWVMMTP